jgi:tungstate transport system substrate-binding protein
LLDVLDFAGVTEFTGVALTGSSNPVILNHEQMGATLTIASEKQACTLTDRATYLANKDNLELEILFEGDAALLNVYHVITVNPEKWPKSNYDGAVAFSEFMTAPETQAVIGEFGQDKFGQPLFFPDADKTDEDLGI